MYATMRITTHLSLFNNFKFFLLFSSISTLLLPFKVRVNLTELTLEIVETYRSIFIINIFWWILWNVLADIVEDWTEHYLRFVLCTFVLIKVIKLLIELTSYVIRMLKMSFSSLIKFIFKSQIPCKKSTPKSSNWCCMFGYFSVVPGANELMDVTVWNARIPFNSLTGCILVLRVFLWN